MAADSPPAVQQTSSSGTKRSYDIAFLASSASSGERPASPSGSAFSRVTTSTASTFLISGSAEKPTNAGEMFLSSLAAGVGTSTRSDLSSTIMPAAPPPRLAGGVYPLPLPLLRPTLVSLYSSQNVCALCGIGFRMTSDLVFHMRSQHRRPEERRRHRQRDDRLHCTVCGETFRERHHLTRHMTAHAERDGDEHDT